MDCEINLYSSESTWTRARQTTHRLQYLTTSSLYDCKLTFKSFADDTQLYDSSSSEQIQVSITKIQNWFSDVKSWMSTNKLKLNDEKTELLLIHSKHKVGTGSSLLSTREQDTKAILTQLACLF